MESKITRKPGHEVIGKLIDADADIGRAGSSGGRGSSGRSCSRGSSGRGRGTAAGSQDTSSTHNSGSLQEVTTRDHFHNFVLLHYACHSISQIALFARFAVSVCIITICGTVRNRTNHQDSLLYFVRVPQDLLLYPKIFLLSSTILHVCATCVQKSCVCA